MTPVPRHVLVERTEDLPNLIRTLVGSATRCANECVKKLNSPRERVTPGGSSPHRPTQTLTRDSRRKRVSDFLAKRDRSLPPLARLDGIGVDAHVVPRQEGVCPRQLWSWSMRLKESDCLAKRVE